MALVLLRYYSTSMEAAIARSLLVTRGVLAFRFDREGECDTSEPCGLPTRLMVAEEDYEAAADILAGIDAAGEPGTP